MFIIETLTNFDFRLKWKYEIIWYIDVILYVANFFKNQQTSHSSEPAVKVAALIDLNIQLCLGISHA